MRITLSERDLREIDFAALRRLTESASPATAVICRSKDEARAWVIHIEEYKAKFEASEASEARLR